MQQGVVGPHDVGDITPNNVQNAGNLDVEAISRICASLPSRPPAHGQHRQRTIVASDVGLTAPARRDVRRYHLTRAASRRRSGYEFRAQSGTVNSV
jgi:hypothetical protein